jgi:hypothetical protein
MHWSLNQRHLQLAPHILEMNPKRGPQRELVTQQDL